MIILQAVNAENAQAAFQLFEKLSPKFFIRLLVDLVSVILLIRLIYLPNNKNKEKVFTFQIFNLIIFLITFLMNKVDMSMGAAFGLFAVFTMLRYRTENITTKDMTYMFIMIALGLINAVMKGNWDELIIVNLIVIAATFILESNLIIKKETSRLIYYDNMELIRPDRRKELMEDLERKTGVKINHISFRRIDFVREIAQIYIYYNE